MFICFPFLVISESEKIIKAITPINNPLNINKNSLSLEGFLPVTRIPKRNKNNIIVTIGVNILAINGEILLTT